MGLCLIALTGGDTARLRAVSQRTISNAEKTGDTLLLYIGHGYLAWAESRLGNHAAASEAMAKSEQIGRQSGGRLVGADLFAAASAEIALRAGRTTDALALVEETVNSAKLADDLYAQGFAHRIWAEALAAGEAPDYDQAEMHLYESLRSFEKGDARIEAARTRVALGELRTRRGDVDGARNYFDQAVVQFETSGLAEETKRTRELMSI
jgi:tetratricopeptide (TPR) repeat protein